MSNYGDRLKNLRRLFHQYLGTKAAVASFVPVLEMEARRFLLRTINDPSSLQEQIRRCVSSAVHNTARRSSLCVCRLAGSVILILTHGYAINPKGVDNLVHLADELMIEFALATTPGLWMVDIIPARKFAALLRHSRLTFSQCSIFPIGSREQASSVPHADGESVRLNLSRNPSISSKPKLPRAKLDPASLPLSSQTLRPAGTNT